MTKENLKPLKTLVFSMGLVLVGGTVLLAGAVWKKIAAEPAANGQQSAECTGGQVNLKGHGPMVDFSMNGQTLRMIFGKREGLNEVVMVDICSGKVTGALSVETDAAGIEE